jgi:hypothetical protein
MSFGGVLRAGQLLPQGPFSLLVWPLQISFVVRQRQGLSVSEVAPRVRLDELLQPLGEEGAASTAN